MGDGTRSANWLGHWEAYQQTLRLGQLESYRQRRWQRSDEFSTWLDQSTLPSLTMEQTLALYRASGGGRTGEFKTNPIEEVRDSLDFLLFDTIMLVGRFDECASQEGAYNLAGTGNGHLGLGYLDLLESLQPVRQQPGLADFRSVDEFAYALSQPAKRTGG